MTKEGFTKIPNHILETLAKTKMPNSATRYIAFLIRKTLGFHKTEDYISNSQFVKGTGMRKGHVSRTERMLQENNVITKRDNRIIGLNSNCEEWKLLPKQVTVTNPCNKVTNSGEKVTLTGVHKINDTKETKQKKENFSSFNKTLTEYGRTPEEQKALDKKMAEIKEKLFGLRDKFKMPERIRNK